MENEVVIYLDGVKTATVIVQDVRHAVRESKYLIETLAAMREVDPSRFDAFLYDNDDERRMELQHLTPIVHKNEVIVN
jgi:hypothetical protein